MRYPTLNGQASYRQMVDAFLGYNHNPRMGDGEFYDMENMTSSHYPLLAPRGRRGTFLSAGDGNFQGLIAKDALCYVDGTKFVIDEYTVNMGLSTEPEDCPKRLISMGAYVIILPDKKYINTKDLNDFGDIEGGAETQGTVTFSLCDLQGEVYENIASSDTAPEAPENKAYWMDRSEKPHVLKQWSSTSSTWVTVPMTYVKISSPGIGANFSQYDGITISYPEGELHSAATGDVLSDTVIEQLRALEGSAVVWHKSDDAIVVVGLLEEDASISDAVTIRRSMPDMDVVVESGNRLWGCKYGLADGKVINEIYASKLGDFKNWNCFMGLSTDSYAASCGTDGPFTGAVTHLGYPLFFKENFLHKVYGTVPANFQIQTTACRGVQKGSSESLSIVNAILYYKGENGICRYDGSLPEEISTALGNVRYENAVAGAHGNKYYVSMEDPEGQAQLFVYDTLRGVWHREDHLRVRAFCSCRGELYALDGDGNIRTMFGSETTDSEPVSWFVETGDLGLSSPDRKYLSRLTIRLSLWKGTTVRIWAQYDRSGIWEELFHTTGTCFRSFAVPVRPRRSDHLKLKIEGMGDARIYSITKTIEEGSDCW